MNEVRPPSRVIRAAEDFFIDRRWWQFVPIPFTAFVLINYRGPYDIAGGRWVGYAAAGIVVTANALLVGLPKGPVRWGPALLVVMCAAAGVMAFAIPRPWVIALPYLLATAATRRYRFRAAAMVVGVAGATVVTVEIGGRANWLAAVAAVAILAALVMSSLVRRSRADRMEQMELALAREQAAREEHARAATLAERARIAREVHDVLAHSLSALSLNLQGAKLMLAREGASEQAHEQISLAQRLAAEGLTEARRAVAALRDDPVPAARAIADLVTSSRLETGTPTALTIEGTPHDLPGAAEDALFRTAQEALSNARKHAAGAPVDVLLAYRDGTTELTVTDHQGYRPPDRATGGYGLSGMRERAELIGGQLITGPTDDGWQVRLVVPA